jgi:hypothetical protein
MEKSAAGSKWQATSGASMLNNNEIDSITRENEVRAKGLKDIFTK